MKPEIEAVVKRSCAMGAAIAVVASPVPLADELALLPLYGWMAVRIGREHGLEARALPWRAMSATVAKGLLARGLMNLSVSFLPGVAAVANAASVTAFTWWLGGYMDRACGAPGEATVPPVREMFALLKSLVTQPKPATVTAT